MPLIENLVEPPLAAGDRDQMSQSVSNIWPLFLMLSRCQIILQLLCTTPDAFSTGFNLAWTQHHASPEKHHVHSEAWLLECHALGCFSSAGTGALVKVEGIMYRPKSCNLFSCLWRRKKKAQDEEEFHLLAWHWPHAYIQINKGMFLLQKALEWFDQILVSACVH